MKKLFKKAKYAVIALAVALFGFIGLVKADETPVPAGGVPVEASLAVANATTGGGYHDSVTTKVNDVVNVQVWYHNPEPVNSGHVAKDVNVKINLPGDNSTKHAITSRVGGSNTNVITDLANVTSSVNTTLEYIPGTANRRYNAGTNDKPNWVNAKLPDSIVTGGYTVTKLNPCWNFAETITVQVRVNAPSVSIVKKVKVEGTSEWKYDIEARPGDLLAYSIYVKNEGNVMLNDLVIRDALPQGLTFVSGSAKLFNTAYPNGLTVPDDVVKGGVIVGDYKPGSTAQIRLNARVPQTMHEFKCYQFENTGITKAKEVGEYYNITKTKVCYAKPDEDKVEIKVLKFNDQNGNKTQDNGENNLAGWSFRVSGPDFNQVVTTDASGMTFVKGLKPGRYTVTEILQDGWLNTTGIAITRDVTVDLGTQTFVFGNRKKDEPKPPVCTTCGDGKGNIETLPVSGPLETAAATGVSMLATGGVLSYIRSRKLVGKATRKN